MLGLVGWAILVGTVRAEPPPDGPPAAVLELVEGGSLPGVLRPATGPETFLWDCPLFAAPLEFRTTAVVRLQFPQHAPPPPLTGWRVDLSGGDTVCGRIVAMDTESIAIDCPAAPGQSLRLRRSWIERMVRVPDRGTLLVPGDRSRWQTAGKAWRVVAGRPATADAGAAIWLPAEQPPRVCLEMVLSWQVRPDLRIDLGAAAGWLERLVAGQANVKSATPDEYRLEIFSGRLLAIREGRVTKFDELTRLPDEPGRLRLQVFMDRTTGRLAIRLPGQPGTEGLLPFDATVPPPGPPRGPVGWGLKLRSGDVRIDELTVIPWTEELPRLHPGAALTMETIDSFDTAADAFVVRADGGERRVAAATVADITGAARAHPAALGQLAVVAPGLRLTGTIAALGDTEIGCDAPALGARLVLPRRAVSALEAPAVPGMQLLPGRMGWLEAGPSRVLGCVATAGPGKGVGWQPMGAVAAVPLAADAMARIDYAGGDRVAGVGIEPIRQGQGWGVAVLVPQGPAARSGRIREGWMIETITQLPAGEPVTARAVKSIDMVRSLLRGMPGSAVDVSFTTDAGGVERAVLVRDTAGRGDLAGAAEADVLDKVLRAHAEQARPAEDDPRWPAVIFLATGDSLRGQVRAANSAGLEAELEVGGVVTIPNAALRAVELQPAGVKPLPRQKMDRLLTLPRMQRSQPPTHLLRTVAGDYIRGRLVSLDRDQVTLALLEDRKSFPRSDVARIIWLAMAAGPGPEAAGASVRTAPGTPVQVVTAEGRRLTLGVTGVDAGMLVGHSPSCGAVRVTIARCERILVGEAIEEFAPAELPYSQWVLREAGR
jgi:hypothetical protein